MLAEKGIEPEVREGVEMLYGKVRYLTQIIAQLLILSRVDQGRAKVARERVNFSELTQIAVEEAAERAKEKNITVLADISEGLMLLGDETLLIRFWMNLLNNAIAYGRDGGQIRVSLRAWGDEITGEIRDDGIGISEEALPHIWERFYQEDASRDRKQQQFRVGTFYGAVDCEGTREEISVSAAEKGRAVVSILLFQQMRQEDETG